MLVTLLNSLEMAEETSPLENRRLLAATSSKGESCEKGQRILFSNYDLCRRDTNDSKSTKGTTKIKIRKVLSQTFRDCTAILAGINISAQRGVILATIKNQSRPHPAPHLALNATHDNGSPFVVTVKLTV